MRFRSSILVALCLCAPAFGATSGEGLAGTFQLSLGDSGNRVDMRLACWKEAEAMRCMASSVVEGPGAARETVDQPFNDVRPVADLSEARNALRYAIGQRTRPIANEDLARSMAALRPVLASSPSIDQCWDLNDPTPGYMLACTLKDVPPGSPPAYLFGTLMANCGEGFCRYVITPMSRVR